MIREKTAGVGSRELVEDVQIGECSGIYENANMRAKIKFLVDVVKAQNFEKFMPSMFEPAILFAGGRGLDSSQDG